MNKENINENIQTAFDIKVIGFGGSGCNSINRLSSLKLDRVELIAANTDFQSLAACDADKKIQLGGNSTKGLGTGGSYQKGKKAAEENYRELINAIKDAELVFLTTGMGGGTGSGAIEITARIAASLALPTFSIVTLPFSFESDNRKALAYEATLNLQPFTNTLITIPNDRIYDIADAHSPLSSTLGLTDDILINCISGITEILNPVGLINIDFSHIKRMLEQSGGAYIGNGFGEGENRSISAIHNALIHPLLEAPPLHQAKGVVIRIIGDLQINEINEALDYIKEKLPAETEVIPVIEQRFLHNNQIKISMMITGLGAGTIPVYQSNPSIQNGVDKELFSTSGSEIKSTDSQSSIGFNEELEVPAFIRKGYNSIKLNSQ